MESKDVRTPNSVTFVIDENVDVRPCQYRADFRPGSFIHLFRKAEQNGRVLACSDYDRTTFVPEAGGLVEAILRAYRGHHNLCLRPDDVWLAIGAQFARFVEANAESLRHLFVNHEGKKTLVVRMRGPITDPATITSMAADFEQLIDKNVKDPELRAWIVPDFSTTTPTDRAVGSMMLMATCKQYFQYMMAGCGIRQVTLQGTPEDWYDVEQRAARLAKYGGKCAEWAGMLAPILEQFTAASEGHPDAAFWRDMCHISGDGGFYSTQYVSGWVTAFGVFGDKGQWLGDIKQNPEGGPLVSPWCFLNIRAITKGYAECDVTVDDGVEEYETTLYLGVVGTNAMPDGVTVKPTVAWGLWRNDPPRAGADEAGSRWWPWLPPRRF